MLVAGDYSPHLEDVLYTMSHLDPVYSSLMEVADSGGTPLEEQPAKMANALRLFLQGLGFGELTLQALEWVFNLNLQSIPVINSHCKGECYSHQNPNDDMYSCETYWIWVIELSRLKNGR